MNQIIEELKNEDGRYKIRRLSDYKLQLEYKVPIFATHVDSVRVIDTINIKVRYKIFKSKIKDFFFQIFFIKIYFFSD